MGWVAAGLAVVCWVVLTVRGGGGGLLRTVAEWPGARTVDAYRDAVKPHLRRRIAVHSRLAWARYRCWLRGVNI